MIDTLASPFQFAFMHNAFLMMAMIAVPTSAAVLLSGAQGLVADGRCDQPRGAAGGGAGLSCLNIPLIIGAFVAGMFCALATGFLSSQQPGQARHGHGDRVFGHVRPWHRAVHQDHDRRASRSYPVWQHAGRRRARICGRRG